MTDYLSKGSTVTGTYDADELRKLCEAMKSKRQGKLRHGVLLLHDNTPAHTSAVVTSAAAECGGSTIFARSSTLPLLKEHLSGTHF